MSWRSPVLAGARIEARIAQIRGNMQVIPLSSFPTHTMEWIEETSRGASEVPSEVVPEVVLDVACLEDSLRGSGQGSTTRESVSIEDDLDTDMSNLLSEVLAIDDEELETFDPDIAENRVSVIWTLPVSTASSCILLD